MKGVCLALFLATLTGGSDALMLNEKRSYGELDIYDASELFGSGASTLLEANHPAATKLSQRHGGKESDLWDAQLTESVEAATTGTPVPHVGCTSNSEASQTRSKLEKLSGRPIFVSHDEDQVTCFRFMANKKGAGALLFTDALLWASPIPSVAKFAPSLVRTDSHPLLSERLQEHMAKMPHLYPMTEQATTTMMERAEAKKAERQKQSTNILSGLLHDNPEPQLKLTLNGEVRAATIQDWLTTLNTEECSTSSLRISTIVKPERKYRATSTVAVLSNLETMATAEELDSCWFDLTMGLASLPEVIEMEPKAKQSTRNYYAHMTTQSGYISGETPLFDMGINGTGQVVGVADTGLDDQSCFFNDPEYGNVTRTYPTVTNVDGDGYVKNWTWINTTVETYRRKVIEYLAYVDGQDYEGGHGTHVVGSVVGYPQDDWESIDGSNPGVDMEGTNVSAYFDNYNPYQSRGMAPGAKVTFFDIGDKNGSLYTPDDLYTELFPTAYDAGARIHSDSWGTSYNGYLSDDLSIDEFCYDYDDMVILIAAGNDGENGLHTVGSPAVSKNAISVGATESGPGRQTNSVNYLASFSSVGPTYDGRIKPDVTAPGYYIISAKSAGYGEGVTCKLEAMAGTSMATPVTAGTTAVLRQYFNDGYYGTHAKSMSTMAESYFSQNDYKGVEMDDDGCLEFYSNCDLTAPSGALVKAMLVSSSRPLTYWNSDVFGKIPLNGSTMEAPDVAQGFGRVAMADIMPEIANHTDQNLFIDDTMQNDNAIKSGKTRTYYVYVNESMHTKFRATLVWMDPPSSTSASKQLVHNLDLWVVTPSDVRYNSNGNNDTYNDKSNNVERVTLPAPVTEEGIYKVYVKAHDLVYDTQDYALVITGPVVVLSTSSGAFKSSGGGGGHYKHKGFTDNIIVAVTAGAVVILSIIAALIYSCGNKKSDSSLGAQDEFSSKKAEMA